VCEMSDTVLLKLQKDIAEIKVALLGNEYNPSGGVLPRLAVAEKEVERLEEDLHALKDRFNKVMWFAAGAGAIAGFALDMVLRWIE